VPANPGALVFTGPSGGALDRTNFRERVWAPACGEVGVDVTFHDLQHAAATLAAIGGATTRELMARLGHSSQQAAIRYQHATADRDAAIAEALAGMVTAAGLAPVVELPRDGRAMDAV
jgi:integrase